MVYDSSASSTVSFNEEECRMAEWMQDPAADHGLTADPVDGHPHVLSDMEQSADLSWGRCKEEMQKRWRPENKAKKARKRAKNSTNPSTLS